MIEIVLNPEEEVVSVQEEIEVEEEVSVKNVPVEDPEEEVVVDYRKVEYLDPEQIIKGEELKGEEIIYEKSAVSGSGNIDRSVSAEIVNIENYDKTILWTNTSPTTNFTAKSVQLSDDINNYDILGFEFSSGNENLILVPVEIFKKYTLTGNTRTCAGSNLIKYGSLYYSRAFYFDTNYSIYFASGFRCLPSSDSAAVDNTVLTPLNVYGYKAKTLSNSNPDSIVSGNNVYNYNIYCSVSDDSLSYNIINKPISEYNTQEGLLFMLLVGFMGAGLVHLIRKAVIRWN